MPSKKVQCKENIYSAVAENCVGMAAHYYLLLNSVQYIVNRRSKKSYNKINKRALRQRPAGDHTSTRRDRLGKQERDDERLGKSRCSHHMFLRENGVRSKCFMGLLERAVET
jgi:hypothetical protein